MSHRIGRKRLRKAAVIRDDDEDEEEDAADAAPAEDMDAADGDGRPTGDETAAPAAASSSLQAYFKGRPTGASPPGAAKPSASAGGDAPVNETTAPPAAAPAAAPKKKAEQKTLDGGSAGGKPSSSGAKRVGTSLLDLKATLCHVLVGREMREERRDRRGARRERRERGMRDHPIRSETSPLNLRRTALRMTLRGPFSGPSRALLRPSPDPPCRRTSRTTPRRRRRGARARTFLSPSWPMPSVCRCGAAALRPALEQTCIRLHPHSSPTPPTVLRRRGPCAGLPRVLVCIRGRCTGERRKSDVLTAGLRRAARSRPSWRSRRRASGSSSRSSCATRSAPSSQPRPSSCTRPSASRRTRRSQRGHSTRTRTRTRTRTCSPDLLHTHLPRPSAHAASGTERPVLSPARAFLHLAPLTRSPPHSPPPPTPHVPPQDRRVLRGSRAWRGRLDHDQGGSPAPSAAESRLGR